MYNQDIELVYSVPTDPANPVNANGFPMNTEVAISVFADSDSIGGAEMYAALRNDISLIFLLKLRKEDWELSKHVVNGYFEYADKIRYEGALYKVIKTFTKDYVTEVSCGKV